MKSEHAKGNLKLGVLYGKLGDHRAAAESLERYYRVALAEAEGRGAVAHFAGMGSLRTSPVPPEAPDSGGALPTDSRPGSGRHAKNAAPQASLNLDVAKMHLGVARANAKMTTLLGLVTGGDMGSLLEFKRRGYPYLQERV